MSLNEKYNIDNKKIINKEILLPNLIFKDNKICWNFNEKVNINEDGINREIKYLEMGDIQLYGEVEVLEHLFKCRINKKNLKYGLSVTIEYSDDDRIQDLQLARVARLIEATLLNINIDDEQYKNENLFYDNENKTKDINIEDDISW